MSQPPPPPPEATPPPPPPPAEAAPPEAPPGNLTPPGEDHDIPELLAVLPVRATVVFPGTVMPMAVGRPRTLKLLDESLPASPVIAVITQRDGEEIEPQPQGLYDVGVAVKVLKMMRPAEAEQSEVTIIVHGLARIRVRKFTQKTPYYKAQVEQVTETPGSGRHFEAAVAQLMVQARELIELAPNAPEQAVEIMMSIDDPSNLADFLAANLEIGVEHKQTLLEELDVAKRIAAVHQHVAKQLENLKLQQKIQEDVQSSISQSQRKMFLREQLKAIQKELGEGEGGGDAALIELRKRLEQAAPPEKVMAEATRELERLELIPPASPEYAMLLTYLELVADLPWNRASEDKLDLDRARKILDRDHFDLDKIKRRLIEYLAVRKLNPDGRGPILCLVGPPGVGKTSLGQSIADALGRQFVRMSLGGIRDEAEIRGHRRTYIGAMPGRIIQELRRAATNNPVMMLDEVDKLSADFHGDPASALLEVLDPRQNNAFVDRYLDVPFDLSQVIFIATANYIGNVPHALQDRMEVTEIPGYTDNDKLQIARRYLVPRQLEENGLTKARCKWSSPAIRKVISDYTREAGVRNLERNIGSVCRGVAAEVAGEATPTKKTWNVDPPLVRKLLGPERNYREVDTRVRMAGVAIGLAYTPVGGEVLFIEAAAYYGSGRVNLTGQIGDVMKESAAAAMSLFKSRADSFHYDLEKLARLDVHMHVPAGAVPKDGPSAGIAMYTAIASLLLDIPVKPRLAMTGEITLRGLVLPIGGVKEKTLAAARAGVKTVLLPKDNQRDDEEIDDKVRKQCQLIYVETVDEVLEHALGRQRLDKAIKAQRSRGPAETSNQKQAARAADG